MYLNKSSGVRLLPGQKSGLIFHFVLLPAELWPCKCRAQSGPFRIGLVISREAAPPIGFNLHSIATEVDIGEDWFGSLILVPGVNAQWQIDLDVSALLPGVG